MCTARLRVGGGRGCWAVRTSQWNSHSFSERELSLPFPTLDEQTEAQRHTLAQRYQPLVSEPGSLCSTRLTNSPGKEEGHIVSPFYR